MNCSTRFLTRHVIRSKLVSTNNCRAHLILTFQQREFSLHKNISFSYINRKLKSTNYLKKSTFFVYTSPYLPFSSKQFKMESDSIDFNNYQVWNFWNLFVFCQNNSKYKTIFKSSIDKLNELQMMQAISQQSPIELVKNRIYNTKAMCQKLNVTVI